MYGSDSRGKRLTPSMSSGHGTRPGFHVSPSQEGDARHLRQERPGLRFAVTATGEPEELLHDRREAVYKGN